MRKPVGRHDGRNMYRSESGRKERRLGPTLAVMAVLLAGLFVVALLIANPWGNSMVSSSLPFEPISAAQRPETKPPAQVSQPKPKPVAEPSSIPRVPTEWDEENIPELFNFINRRFLPEGYIGEHELVAVGNGQQMQARAGEAFLAMQAAAEEDGVGLRPLSGYRNTGLQYNIFYNKLNLYRSQGLPEETCRYNTIRYHAYPGTSEHEAALAMDIGDNTVPGTDIEDSFANTPAFDWLQEHCVEYGFIFRYQSDTESITGIAFEPWHYRYVGANHAEAITERDITLEEYVFELEKEEGVQTQGENSVLGGIPGQPWPENTA